VLPGPGIINTVAGDANRGFSGDGGLATTASLNNPWGVAVDYSGKHLHADTNNNRIREVSAATGKINTVAGSGTACANPTGTCGDGGSATSAQLSGPRGVAVDTAGNIYIADTGNNKIREVSVTTLIISTVAGNGTAGDTGDTGKATLAEVNAPANLAIDYSGNIYLSDTNDGVVREVTKSTGNIFRVAGGGNGTCGGGQTDTVGDNCPATSAKLDVPEGVAVDASGNLYIADTAYNRIREVLASTGYIYTVAGNGNACSSPTASCGDGGSAISAQINNPFGVAVDSDFNIYIADTGDQRIRLVTKSTSGISTVAGTGTAGFSGDTGAALSADLDNPEGIAVDNFGNIYLTDEVDSRIRAVGTEYAHIEIPAHGDINTVAGDGTTGFSGDGGAATSAELNSVEGVAVDAADNVYIADKWNRRVRKVSALTGIISTVAGCNCSGGGNGYPATSTNLHLVGDVAVDGSGNFYLTDLITDQGFSFVLKVTASTGLVSTLAGGGHGCTGQTDSVGDGCPATSARLAPNAAFIALDGAGNLYISDTGRVRAVNTGTAAVTIAGVVIQPGYIATVAGGATAICSGHTDSVGDGCPATSALLNGNEGVAVDAAGNIYIADSSSVIRKVKASTGIISIVAGTLGTTGYSGDGGAATSADLNSPYGVALDSAGNFYFVDGGNSRIRKVTVSTGIISLVAGDGTRGYSGDGGAAVAAELSNQFGGVAVDAAGNVYLGDSGNARVRVVNQ